MKNQFLHLRSESVLIKNIVKPFLTRYATLLDRLASRYGISLLANMAKKATVLITTLSPSFTDQDLQNALEIDRFLRSASGYGAKVLSTLEQFHSHQ